VPPHDRFVPVAYREPFAFNGPCWVDHRRAGENILDIVLSVPNLPPTFLSRGVVCINGEVVPRDLWSRVRPKPTSDQLPIAVTMHWPLQGGGRAGTKAIVGVVAAIALVVVTAGLATPGVIAGFAPGLAGFAGTTFGFVTGAQIIAGAVGILGSLAISALTRPPTQAATQDIVTAGEAASASGGGTKEAAGASGNVLQRGGAIPRVIGTRKVYPPFACEPLVETLTSDTETVEVLCVLNGPHFIEDIRVDGVPVDGAGDIEFETGFGTSTDVESDLIQRTGRTLTPNLRLSQHILANDNVTLGNESEPESCLPVFHGFVSKPDADRVWLHLNFPGGLTNAAGDEWQIPFRIRMREKGGNEGDWINFPEVHFNNSTTNQLRQTIEFRWIDDYDDAGSVPSSNGWVYAITDPPPQSATPATPSDRDWDSDGYFYSGSGDSYISSANSGSTGVINVKLDNSFVRYYLASSGTPLPKGPAYEIEIKRGAAFYSDGFSRDASYLWTPAGPGVADFFWYVESGGNFHNPINVSDSIAQQVVLSRVVSVWNEDGEDPIHSQAFAYIAIKAVNRQINSVSCVASGLVYDWTGTAWDGGGDYSVTSNPAPHYVDVLRGSLNFDPLEEDLLDNDTLVEWRTLCATNDWTCDAIIDDQRTQDVLDLLASCGYAKPYQSDLYGVTIDKDRSGDSPIQVFSPVNSRNFSYQHAFARVPEGLLITYRDEDNDDDQAQVTVSQRDPSIGVQGFFENAAYDGLINVAKVEARALFDLDQANMRSTFYSLETDIESIVCRRGDLIAVQHDVLTQRSGYAHIVSKQTSAGNITGVTLDSSIYVSNAVNMHTITDMHLVTDLHGTAEGSGMSIRHLDGTISTHRISNAGGAYYTVITFTTPFTDTAQIVGYNDTDRTHGSMIVSGDYGSEYLRLLVATITPGQDLTATLTLVDEAQDLERYAP
jgi:hypothetical protein